MSRLAAVLLSFLLVVLATAGVASAHAMAVTAVVTPAGAGKVTIQVVDVYDAPIPVGPLKAVWSDGREKRELPLTAGPDQTYVAEGVPAGGELSLETTIAGDVFRVKLPPPETAMARVPMTQFERGAKVWLPLAFFGFALVAIAGVIVYSFARPVKQEQ
ncbi:MAG TPA: hypothetical protein VK464_22930 [Symbiobacteriaceae bacterium]|nr:hypothetical protein [Symbiobacteriaceae bacterium]